MFNNLGLHTEVLTPISVILLVLGAVLVYGGKYILSKLTGKPSEKTVFVLKLVGLLLATAGVIVIFTR